MLMFKFSRVIGVSAVLFSLTACFGNGFQGESGDQPAKSEVKPKEQDRGAAKQDQNKIQQQNGSVNKSDNNSQQNGYSQNSQQQYSYPNNVRPGIQAEDEIRPQQPPVAPEQNRIVPPQVTTSGLLTFNAIVFVNMEKRQHATDMGTMAVLRTAGSNQVVAAGEMSVASAAVNGATGTGGGAYPVTKLGVAMTRVSAEPSTGGQGLLSICPVTEQSRKDGTFQCDKSKLASSDGDRPVHWVDRKVNYTVSGKDVSVNNQPTGQGEYVKDGLTFAHAFTMGTVAAESDPYPDANSPLVLDLNGNKKLDLTDVENTKLDIRFDLDASNSGKRNGWVEPTDGLLAIDTNNNGTIDNGSELFGEFSARLNSAPNVPYKRFANGFDALAQYDSNKDRRIDKQDTDFNRIVVWQDLNLDGKSQVNELSTLAKSGVASINLKFSATGEDSSRSYLRVANNEVRYVGNFVGKDSKVGLIADVWFTRKAAGTSLAAQKSK